MRVPPPPLLLAAVVAVAASTRMDASAGVAASAVDAGPCSVEGVSIPRRSTKYVVGRPHQRGAIYATCDPRGRVACFEDPGLADAPAYAYPQVACDARTIHARRRKLGVAVNLVEDKWPNGLVFYRFSEKYPLAPNERDMVRKAIQMYEATDLGVAFQECEPTSLCKNKYVDISQKEDACYSYVGYTGEGGGQIMNLGKSCFEEPGTAVHEIGHALGLYHEHTHPDREVIVLTDLNLPVSASNYAKETDATLKPYDKASIMHYGRSAGLCLPKDQYPLESFCDVEITTNCVMPKKTHCNNTRNSEIGQRTTLSAGDINTLKALYGTQKPTLKPTPAPTPSSEAPPSTPETPSSSSPSSTTPEPSSTTKAPEPTSQSPTPIPPAPSPPPTTTAPPPAATTPQPSTTAPTPTTSTPAQSTSTPTTTAPAPTTTAPTQTTTAPSPSSSAPSPSTSAPAPSTTAPTPSSSVPAPSSSAPAPPTVTSRKPASSAPPSQSPMPSVAPGSPTPTPSASSNATTPVPATSPPATSTPGTTPPISQTTRPTTTTARPVTTKPVPPTRPVPTASSRRPTPTTEAPEAYRPGYVIPDNNSPGWWNWWNANKKNKKWADLPHPEGGGGKWWQSWSETQDVAGDSDKFNPMQQKPPGNKVNNQPMAQSYWVPPGGKAPAPPAAPPKPKNGYSFRGWWGR